MNGLVTMYVLLFFIFSNVQEIVSVQISLTTPKEIEDFAKTMTNRLEVLMAIKIRRLKPTIKTKEFPFFNPKRLTQSEAYILAKTKEKNITSKTLEKAIDQQINIQQRYFTFTQEPAKIKKMVKIILGNERRYRHYYVLYHAYRGVYKEERLYLKEEKISTKEEQTAGPGLLFDFYQELYKWVFILPQTNKLLRLLNKGYEKYPNINTFIERFPYWHKYSAPDHEQEFIAYAIPANVALFGNTYTEGEESTFDFWLSSRSLRAPNIRQRLEKIFDLFNFNKQYIDELIKMYKSYMQKSGGHLLQIFFSPETINDVAYLSLQGGFLYDQKITESYDNEKRRHTDISTVLDLYKTNIRSIKPYSGENLRFLSELKINKEHPYDFLQARILTIPGIFADPKKVKILRYFALEQPNEQAYKRDLHNIMKKIMQDWIEQKIKNKKTVIHPELLGKITNIDLLMNYIFGDPLTWSLWSSLVEGKLEEIKNLVNEKKVSLHDSIRGYTPLMIATKYGHKDVMKWILEKVKAIKINIDQTNKIGYSALMYAVEKKNSVLCKLLLQAGSNANQQFPDGYPLLTKAIKNKNFEIIKLLVEHKSQLNQKDTVDNKTPLMHALEAQLVDVCSILLQAGSSPNQEYYEGSNVLTKAIQLKNLQIIKLLVEYNAKIDAFNGTENTPILKAFKLKNKVIVLKIVQALLESPILPDLNSIEGGVFSLAFELEHMSNKETQRKLLKLFKSKGLTL